MNKSEHTPGPWTVDTEHGIVFDASGAPVQTGGAWCSEETRANARLIAAAPEMFDQLLRAERLLRGRPLPTDPGMVQCLKELRQVLAKAQAQEVESVKDATK